MISNSSYHILYQSCFDYLPVNCEMPLSPNSKTGRTYIELILRVKSQVHSYRCETCGTEEAKYRCPRCMRFSCR